MDINGFTWQLLWGVLITLKIALASAALGIGIGLLAALLGSLPIRWLNIFASSLIFIIRGIPELLVLFFIYFGLTAIISYFFQTYIEVSPFAASVTALSLIFGAYASQVFKGAFRAIDKGQIEAAKALGFPRGLIFTHIEIPQAWRHAIPGLGNLWLVLLKDTAIVMLIGLNDLMGQAKIAASTTHQPFTYYLLAAVIYLVITFISKKIIQYLTTRANRYIPAHDQLYS